MTRKTITRHYERGSVITEFVKNPEYGHVCDECGGLSNEPIDIRIISISANAAAYLTDFGTQCPICSADVGKIAENYGRVAFGQEE